jgi:hypothetical protein
MSFPLVGNLSEKSEGLPEGYLKTAHNTYKLLGD